MELQCTYVSRIHRSATNCVMTLSTPPGHRSARAGMGDELWDCYDGGGAYERFEEEEEEEERERSPSFPLTVSLQPSSQPSSQPSIAVTVYESYQHVFSSTGTHVWEASLLLCSYIHFNIDIFVCRKVAEIGCGAALPSLYLSKQFTRDGSSSLYITDCDTEVLFSLYENLSSHSGGVPATPGPATGEAATCTVVIDTIDWARLDDCSALNECDTIIGSALVYLSEHALHLASLIDRFLTSPRKKEVVIVQIRDRSGWEDLILQLTAIGVSFVCEEVSDTVYNWAQNIVSQKLKTTTTYQHKQFWFPTNTSVYNNTGSLITTKRKDFVVLKCYNV